MGRLQQLSITAGTPQKEFLRIHKSAGRITGHIHVFRYRDKDTRQIVLYSPSLDISGYGATEKKAKEMIDFSLGEYFEYIASLSTKNLHIELSNLGWKHDKLQKKVFSKAYVDRTGELKNLNAVGDKVDLLTLVA